MTDQKGVDTTSPSSSAFWPPANSPPSYHLPLKETMSLSIALIQAVSQASQDTRNQDQLTVTVQGVTAKRCANGLASNG